MEELYLRRGKHASLTRWCSKTDIFPLKAQIFVNAEEMPRGNAPDGSYYSSSAITHDFFSASAEEARNLAVQTHMNFLFKLIHGKLASALGGGIDVDDPDEDSPVHEVGSGALKQTGLVLADHGRGISKRAGLGAGHSNSDTKHDDIHNRFQLEESNTETLEHIEGVRTMRIKDKAAACRFRLKTVSLS